MTLCLRRVVQQSLKQKTHCVFWDGQNGSISSDLNTAFCRRDDNGGVVVDSSVAVGAQEQNVVGTQATRGSRGNLLHVVRFNGQPANGDGFTVDVHRVPQIPGNQGFISFPGFGGVPLPEIVGSAIQADPGLPGGLVEGVLRNACCHDLRPRSG